ncbi:hypothetical protein KR084_004724 [Drosophila pseudotakahashii]|nr:hypothetical protein KR084_004724 [Drosophila pseudotakahashii]
MSTTSSELEDPKYIELKTNDGVTHTVDTRLALQMGPIRELIMLEKEKKVNGNDAIPLARVDAKNMRFIIKWSTAVQDLKSNEEIMRKNILKQILIEEDADYGFLLQLILASNFLQLENLLKASTHLLADAIEACESVQEICKRFNVPADSS